MLQEIWAICASLLLAVVPGGVVLLAARQRGWLLVASPLVTYGLVTGLGGLTSALGLPWSAWVLLAWTLLVAAVVRAVDRFVPVCLAPAPGADEAGDHSGGGRTGSTTPDLGQRDHLLVAGAATLASLFGAFVLRRGMGGLGGMNQDWDAVFHGAAVRWIIETGDMSQAALAELNNRSSVDTFYYPNTWHGLTALGWDLGVHDVLHLLSAGSVLVPFFVSFGLAALVLRATRNPVVAASAALLSVLPSALVYDNLWRGPLLPFTVGLVLVPALVVIFARTFSRRSNGLLLVAGLAAGGVFGIHPSGVYTSVIFLLPWFVQRWWTAPRTFKSDLVTVVAVGFVALVVAAAPLMAALSAGAADQFDWAAEENPGQAFGEAFFLNHARTSPQWPVALLAVVGLFNIRRFPRLTWFWVSGAVAMGLFVAAAAYDTPWAQSVTAVWWNDRFRFAAMVAMFVVVLAAIGALALMEAGARALRAVRVDRRAAAAAPAALLVLAVGVTSHGGYVAQNVERLGYTFHERLIGPSERQLWALAAEIVPEGQMVLNDPVDGSTWMLATEGLRPFFGGMSVPLAGQEESTDPQQVLLHHLDEIATNPAVRQVVADSGAEYVILGGGRMQGLPRSPGMDGLEDNPAFELVEQVGGAQLFRILG